MAASTPQRQPREALEVSAAKGSPGGSSSGDEAVVLLPRGLEDLPEALRSKFSEKARWLAQASRARDELPPPPPALPTTSPSACTASTPAAQPRVPPPPAAEAAAEAGPPSSTSLLRRRRLPQGEAAPGTSQARAVNAPLRKAARRRPIEPERGPPALPTLEPPARRATAAATLEPASAEPVRAGELEKAKKAAEKASSTCADLRKERDRLAKENQVLKRKVQALEAASSRRALAASSKVVAKTSRKQTPVLSLKTAPKEVKIRIKALKTEARHLRRYGVTITLQQPQGMATWTAAVQGARKELGVKGFKPAKKGSRLYKKAKEIAAKLAKKRKAQAKQAARA